MHPIVIISQVVYAVILAEMSSLTTGIATNEQVEEFCKGYDIIHGQVDGSKNNWIVDSTAQTDICQMVD